MPTAKERHGRRRARSRSASEPSQSESDRPRRCRRRGTPPLGERLARVERVLLQLLPTGGAPREGHREQGRRMRRSPEGSSGLSSGSSRDQVQDDLRRNRSRAMRERGRRGKASNSRSSEDRTGRRYDGRKGNIKRVPDYTRARRTSYPQKESDWREMREPGREWARSSPARIRAEGKNPIGGPRGSAARSSEGCSADAGMKIPTTPKASFSGPKSHT